MYVSISTDDEPMQLYYCILLLSSFVAGLSSHVMPNLCASIYGIIEFFGLQKTRWAKDMNQEIKPVVVIPITIASFLKHDGITERF